MFVETIEWLQIPTFPEEFLTQLYFVFSSSSEVVRRHGGTAEGWGTGETKIREEY